MILYFGLSPRRQADQHQCNEVYLITLIMSSCCHLHFDHVTVACTVKHGTQNIQNDCHQWLSGSFRVHTIRFRPGLCPDPTGGAYSAPRDPLAGLRGPNSKGEKKWRKREKEGKRKGTGGTAPLRKFLDPPLRNEPRFEGHLRSPGECRVHS